MSGEEISARHVAELARLGPRYWWIAVRLAHVEAALRAAAPREGLALLDFGCGTGDALAELSARLRPRALAGVDGTDAALAVAAQRGLPVRYADFRRPLELPFAPNAVTCLDVLEHLEDDRLALRALAAACAPRATLVVTVPAMPSLWSRWDEVSGHQRRYTRASLRETLRGSGWEPRRMRYFFAFGVPPAWIERKLLRRVQEFEFPRVSRPLNGLLSALGALERRLGSPLPFGTSLLAVATRARDAAPPATARR